MCTNIYIYTYTYTRTIVYSNSMEFHVILACNLAGNPCILQCENRLGYHWGLHCLIRVSDGVTPT